MSTVDTIRPGAVARSPVVSGGAQPVGPEATPAVTAAPPSAEARDGRAALTLSGRAGPAATRPLPPSPHGSTASIGGAATLPVTVVDSADLAGAVAAATVEVRVPLAAGARIRGGVVGLTVPFDVRRDTELVAKLEVAGGKIDWTASRLWFETRGAGGKPASLDGPLWLNPRALYVRAEKDRAGGVERTLRLDLPGCPDADVTALLLGAHARPLPDTVARLVKALAAESVISPRVATGGARVALGPGEVTRLPAPATPSSPPRRFVQDLLAAINFAGTRVSLAGEVAPGRLVLASGTVDFGPGTTLRAEGRAADLRVEVDARVRGLELAGDGTRLTTGAGVVRLAAGALVPLDSHGATRGRPRLEVALHELSVRDVELSTPAGLDGGAEHELRFDELRAVSAPGAAAAVLWEAADATHPARLALALPDARVTGLAGRLTARGADGSPAVLELGPSGSAPAVTATLTLDTAARSFALDAHLERLDARLGAVSLAESRGLELELSAASLEGSGHVRVSRRGDLAALDVEADPGTLIVARAGVRHAVLGDMRDRTRPRIDLGPDTGALVRLAHLHLASGEAPVFRGSGELGVTLHGLHLPLGGELGVALRAGSTGRLTLHDVARAEGDRSPSLRASLRLDLGVHAVVDPGVPGIPGLRLTIDTATGHTLLDVDATLERDGTLRCEAGVVLEGAELHASVVAADGSRAPPVVLPSDPLSVPAPVVLAATRKPGPARVAPPPAAGSGEVDPVQVVAAVRDGEAEVRIPLRPFTTRLTRVDATGSVLGDRIGADLEISAASDASVARAVLAIRAGKVVPGSRLTLTPPVRLRFDTTLYEPGPGTTTGHHEAELRGARVVVDPRTGRGCFEPELAFATPLPSSVEARVETWVNRTAGALVTRWLVGDEAVPLDATDFTRRLTSRGPTSTPAGDLRRYLRVDEIGLGLEVTRAAPVRVDLGSGQWITLAGGSLAARGTINDLTVDADAELAGLEVGYAGRGVKLGPSHGHVKLRLRRAAEAPSVDLDLTGLSTRGLTLDLLSGDAQAHVRNGSLEAGTLRVRTRLGAPPEIDGELRGLEADLDAVVRLPAGPPGGKAPAPVLDLRRAHVRGGLELSTRGLSARQGLTVTNLDASVTHLTLPPLPYGTVAFDQVDLSGDARLVIAGNGAATIDRLPGGAPLRARARTQGVSLALRQPDLGLEVLGEASLRFDLDALVMGPGAPASVALSNAVFDGVVASGRLRIHDGPSPVKVLDLDRRSLVHLEVPSLATGRFAGSDARSAATRALVRIEGGVRTVVGAGEPGQNSLTGELRLIGSISGDTARGFASESAIVVSGGARVQLEQHVGVAGEGAMVEPSRRMSIRSTRRRPVGLEEAADGARRPARR